ncbi:MAG: biotin/lipoyl-binding protein [Lachnospiraceae bacterium]|nr:biotin/lipoyl-binding protein [Lachnospiraceae bacterium]
MKNYRITVNGNVYDVAVEELGGNVSAAPVMVSAPVAAPAPVVAPAPVAKSSGAGSVKIPAPMPGKILSIKVKVGDVIKKGDVMMILEAMKMENEVVALEDGTVASIDVSEGAMVEASDVLASLN